MKASASQSSLPETSGHAGSARRRQADVDSRTGGSRPGSHQRPKGAAGQRGPFRSILAGDGAMALTAAEPEPEYFADLHLNDIIASMTAGREIYDLKPFFHARLRDVATIRYRHEVFRDLEGPALGTVRSFARQMQTVRDRLSRAGKVHYRYEQERWFLDAAHAYREAVVGLTRELNDADLRSRGLLAFREFLASYVASPGFTALGADTDQLLADLAAVRYRLRIDGSRIIVSRFDAEPDYGAEVLQTFEKFKQGAGEAYRFELSSWQDMNHVEAVILDFVARLQPAVFASLDAYRARHSEFLDPTIGRLDREIQFYVAYLEHIGRLKAAGLAFCYPEVTDTSKEILGRDVFDLALAGLLVGEDEPIVSNDFCLNDPERILVVSGPNQGGKTTFARMVGQLHHLAAIGVLVPGGEARLFLVDRIYTHFERREEVEDLAGKLETDLGRMHGILEEATDDSLLIMNEAFSSTTLTDQLVINREVLRAIIQRKMLGVAVTFLDELASLDPSTVSMVSTVDPEEPARRTFKIVRRRADGLAYAMAIAEKHRLTYERVKARVAR
jgi:DNA mismatch repair protein MutS